MSKRQDTKFASPDRPATFDEQGQQDSRPNHPVTASSRSGARDAGSRDFENGVADDGTVTCGDIAHKDAKETVEAVMAEKTNEMTADQPIPPGMKLPF